MSNPFIVAEDNALKTLIKDALKVKDDKNQDRTVKVWFGYPDVEIRTQDFPFITIDLIDIIPADYRQTQGWLIDTDYRGTVTPVEGALHSYQTPVAYDLIYQISTYARHPRHDRTIMFQLLNKFPSKYGYLPVPNELGTEVSNRTMILDGFVKRDTVDSETGNRRLLRNVLSVRVISEMTPLQAATATQVIETVHINTTTSNIPEGLTPLTPSVITS